MWSPTGLIPWFSKTEGNTYATLLHHPFIFKGKTNACSIGSQKDFWRRCRGGLRSSQDIPSTHHKPISLAFTLFAICLLFSSPPLHPCRFIRPSYVRLFICFDVLLGLFARLVGIVVYLLLNREPKIYGSSSAC